MPQCLAQPYHTQRLVTAALNSKNALFQAPALTAHRGELTYVPAMTWVP